MISKRLVLQAHLWLNQSYHCHRTLLFTKKTKNLHKNYVKNSLCYQLMFRFSFLNGFVLGIEMHTAELNEDIENGREFKRKTNDTT